MRSFIAVILLSVSSITGWYAGLLMGGAPKPVPSFSTDDKMLSEEQWKDWFNSQRFESGLKNPLEN